MRCFHQEPEVSFLSVLFFIWASCCSFLIHFLCLVYIAMSFETLPLFALHNSSPTVQEVTTVSGSWLPTVTESY